MSENDSSSKKPFLELEYDNSDQINYYILPAGSTLFRGDNIIQNINYQFPDRVTYFAFSSIESDEYGMVYQLETTRDVRLVALDNSSNLSKLYENAPKNIRDILIYNYGYQEPGTEKKRVRDSVHEKDTEFSNYLCSLGYEGYSTDLVEDSIDRPNFHREVMLCRPSTIIKIVKQITPETEREKKNEKVKERSLNNVLKDSRKLNKSKLHEVSGIIKPKSLFDDDDDDITNGGKKHKTSKKNRIQKNKIQKKRKTKKNRRSKSRKYKL